MDTQMILDQLRRLVAKHGSIEVVWLYGSRATGQEQPDSDFDLAIAFCEVAKDVLQRQTRCDHLKFEWADKLELPDQAISIVDINGAPIPLAMSVIKGGRVIYSNNTLREAREENRISSMWELDHEYYQREFG